MASLVGEGLLLVGSACRSARGVGDGILGVWWSTVAVVLCAAGGTDMVRYRTGLAVRPPGEFVLARQVDDTQLFVDHVCYLSQGDSPRAQRI